MSAADYNWRSFTFISLGGLLFGYIIGLTGNIATTGQLRCPDGWTGPVGTWTSFGYDQCYEFSNLQLGVVNSLNLLGACISSLICFQYAEDFGRKLEVQLGAALYAVGAAIAALCPVLWAVYLGLGLYGLGIGFAMHAAPVYLAEIAPAQVRGTLIAAKECMIVLGMFLGFAAGAALSDVLFHGWRYMISLAIILAAAMGFGICTVPESPRFLVRREMMGRGATERSSLVDEARASLEFFRQGVPADEIGRELAGIREELASTVSAASASTAFAVLQYPRPLLIGCGLVLLQQISGQPSVLYYATNEFKAAGFGGTAAVASMTVGMVKLIATLVAVFRVDEFGRKPLLIAGIGMMTISLAMISTALRFRTCSVAGLEVWQCRTSDLQMPPGWSAVMLVGLMMYVSGYQIGFGPISWLLIAEVFPLSVRGSALSTAAMVNFGSNLLMNLVQGVLQEALTPSGVFLAYLVICVLSMQFVVSVVPETCGKTLEEIEHDMVVRPGLSPELKAA